MPIPVSVFLICKNEAHHMPRCLSALKDFDEIVVVDSGSTDGTIDIARSFGAKVISHTWEGYAKQKQFAITQCTHEWVLSIDPDEVVLPPMIECIRETVNANRDEAIDFIRDDLFIGQPLSSMSVKKHNCRLYKKHLVEFDPTSKVHERLITHCPIRKTKASFDHYGYGSITILTNKWNQYASLKAEEKFEKGCQPSTLRLGLIFPLIFFKEYFLQRNFLSGKRGFILSVIHAHYAFLKEAKLFEIAVNHNHLIK